MQQQKPLKISAEEKILTGDELRRVLESAGISVRKIALWGKRSRNFKRCYKQWLNITSTNAKAPIPYVNETIAYLREIQPEFLAEDWSALIDALRAEQIISNNGYFPIT